MRLPGRLHDFAVSREMPRFFAAARMRAHSASESMDASWVQFAPNVKGEMRPDKLHPRPQYPGVPTERAYLERLLARTREARERLGKSQAEMAVLLQIPKDTYKTYETRSPLPHYLIDRLPL